MKFLNPNIRIFIILGVSKPESQKEIVNDIVSEITCVNYEINRYKNMKFDDSKLVETIIDNIDTSYQNILNYNDKIIDVVESLENSNEDLITLIYKITQLDTLKKYIE